MQLTRSSHSGNILGAQQLEDIGKLALTVAGYGFQVSLRYAELVKQDTPFGAKEIATRGSNYNADV